MSHPPCQLSALGLITALGHTQAEQWKRVLEGDEAGLQPRADLLREDSRLFGTVGGPLPEIGDAQAHYRSRNNQLVLAAYRGLRGAAEDAIRRWGAARVGIVLGTSTSGLLESERALRESRSRGTLPAGFSLDQLEFGSPADFLRAVSGAAGPSYALSTACSAGGKALISARSLLELGVCDAVIAGAADSLCRMTAQGFHALQALSAARSRPMSANRDGINLGEGAALFLVTRETGGVQLVGAGESSDAHHISAPDPSGRGAAKCMRAALADAEVTPRDIQYLNLHGTGTAHNDAMESRAIADVLGDAIPCSSVKPLLGHTLGASAAIEVGLCWLMLQRSSNALLSPPPHAWDGVRDPELPPLRLVERGETLRAGPGATVLSNAFGFGGSNCSLILSGPNP